MDRGLGMEKDQRYPVIDPGRNAAVKECAVLLKLAKEKERIGSNLRYKI
jgi:hypothetical protein